MTNARANGLTDELPGLAPGESPVVALRNVAKWYGDVVAVSDLSFGIGPGVTGLLGPNGAGKSTVLNMIVGLLAPSAGNVTVLGEPVRSNRRSPGARILLGAQ